MAPKRKNSKITSYFKKKPRASEEQISNLSVAMATKPEDRCKMSPSPSKRTFNSVTCTLKVPNFFILPKYERPFHVDAPPFEFALATWFFRCSSSMFHSLHDDDDDSFDCHRRNVYLHLVRATSEISHQDVFGTIFFLGDDGKVSGENDHSREFEENGDKYFAEFRKSNFSGAKCDSLTMIVYLVASAKETAVEEEEIVNQTPGIPHKGVSPRQDLKELLLNGQDHNITFNVCDKKIKAHRDILQARSEVFHSMLSQDTLEKNSGVIEVPDCDPEAFEQFILHVYTGEIQHLNDKNMFNLYYVADKYSFTRLKEYCCKFIKNSLSVSNLREIVELAVKHDDAGLMDFAMTYFTDNTHVIWPSDQWQLFMKENYVVANEFITKSFQKSYEENAKGRRSYY